MNTALAHPTPQVTPQEYARAGDPLQSIPAASIVSCSKKPGSVAV